MNSNSTVPVVVEMGGTQVVAHVGLHLLGSFADRLGLGHSLSTAIALRGERLPVHDRGKVLTQAMLMLAGGGEACADIEHLRAQPALFGAVPSDSTLYRTFRDIDADTLTAVRDTFGEVRMNAWRRMGSTTGTAPVVLDIDASLHEVHSENKAETAPHYKGGFGFHPIYCFADATGECLAELLRPGNAGADTIGDHVTVLIGRSLSYPPRSLPVTVPVTTRNWCTAHRGAHRFGRVHRFRVACRNTTWAPPSSPANKPRYMPQSHGPSATRPAGSRRSPKMATSAASPPWPNSPISSTCPTGPQDTLMVRREPLHPGAQGSLFPSLQFRYWGHYTDAADGDAVELDVHMRAHAHVEDNIKRLKDSGADRFPFADIDANRAWLAVACMADSLVRWFQQLCCHGVLTVAEPKTLRWTLWHTPARLVRRSRRHVIRILDGWPTASDIIDAYQTVVLIT